jgi:hypothetical protein
LFCVCVKQRVWNAPDLHLICPQYPPTSPNNLFPLKNPTTDVTGLEG